MNSSTANTPPLPAAAPPVGLALQQVTLHLPAFSLVDLCLDVAAGEHVVLMGRTGCGKTSLVEAIAGLRAVDAGTVRIGGRDVTTWRPAAREVGYVPQDAALFNAMRVRDNLGFALAARRVPAAEIAARVAAIADRLGVTHLLDRSPKSLSGGEKQRVALGRALIFHPTLLLLDEPFSALDDATRDRMREVLRDLRRTASLTVLHVTHDRSDADALADRVLLLADGRLTCA